MDEELSERKKKILSALINAHIAFGEPVGSKYLADDNTLGCSSATIRNEMAELEAMGYLEQPHTSAGRIPSARGYRYYVDELRNRYEMTTGEIEQLNFAMQQKMTELDDILSEASKIASTITNYTGLALKSRSQKKKITRFEHAFITERNFVLVMVMDDGEVKSKNIRTSVSLSRDELATFIELLNQYFTNVTAEELSLSRICRVEDSMGYLGAVVGNIAKIVYETLSENGEGGVRFEGVNRLLQYPEYSDREKLRDMLGMIEGNQSGLLDFVEANRKEGNDDVQVYIGKENTVDVMKDSAFVYRTIRHNGAVVGAIGVIGPCRMDYSKVIETLNRVAGGIDRIINEEGK